jgi:hypothetical protein
MDVDQTWTYAQYRAYEQERFEQSLAEQQQALSDGLITDPKSDPHGGYRIACVWPEEVTEPACALSARLAALLPGTPAYPHQAIHSSIGNIAAPGGRLVDPQRIAEDRDLLDRLAAVVERALQAPEQDLEAGAGDRSVAFAPALLAPRMALVFGRSAAGYWWVHRTVHAACRAAGIELVTAWGPHLTLTRFGQPATAAQAKAVAEALAAWEPVTVTPASLLVGYYTVAPKGFRVDPHARFALA